MKTHICTRYDEVDGPCEHCEVEQEQGRKMRRLCGCLTYNSDNCGDLLRHNEFEPAIRRKAMKTKTSKHTPGICRECKQGYTHEAGINAAYPDYIELCPLHAAAPELLEAAKEVLLLAARQMPIVNYAEDNRKLTVLKDAIAKAEGR